MDIQYPWISPNSEKFWIIQLENLRFVFSLESMDYAKIGFDNKNELVVLRGHILKIYNCNVYLFSARFSAAYLGGTLSPRS
jgi:hypothetical protein